MKRFLAAMLVVFGAASVLHGDTKTTGALNRGLANSLYCQLSGCTMTGKLRVIDGTAAAPSIDAAAGGALHFTSSGISVDSGGNANSVIGQGMATVSGGTYGWTSSATDPTGTADLKLARGGAKLLDILGSSAGGLRIDASTFTATRAWGFNLDAADTFVGLIGAQTLTNKSLTSPTLTGLPQIQNTAANAVMRFFNTSATQGGYIAALAGSLSLAINRNPSTATYDDVGKASAALNINAVPGDGNFDFYTTPTNNGTLVQAFKITSTQTLFEPSQALTAGTFTVTNNSEIRTVVTRFDWTNAMITALGAVTAGDITVCTLPSKTRVLNAYLIIDSPDSSANALTIALGRVSATYIDYIVASDAKAAANTVYGDASGERGTNLTGYDLPSITGTTAVKVHLIKTTTNLNTVTGSTGHVYLETQILP